jgi:hypothetical protein
MLTINKYAVVAVIPQFRKGAVSGFYIAAVGAEDAQACSAWIRTTDDTSWAHADIFRVGTHGPDLDDVTAQAVQSAYARANLHILDWWRIGREHAGAVHLPTAAALEGEAAARVRSAPRTRSKST